MLTILFAALCVAAVSADTSAVSSYSASGPTSRREYEYSGGSYLSGKPSSYELGASYVTSSGSSPYAKSDTRYTADSGSDSTSDVRSSLSGSFYKSKYGSESALNSLRPVSFHTSPSSSSSSSSSSASSSSDLTSGQPASGHFTGSTDYTASQQQQQPSYYETNHSPGSSSASSSSEYSFGDQRGAGEHAHQHSYAESSEYARPSTVYSGYAGSPGLTEYSQSRPTSYSHSLSGPAISSLNQDYQHHMSHHHPHHHHSYPSSSSMDDYPPSSSHHVGQPPHAYKTYVMTSSSPKYQSVFGAIKSLFGGTDAAPSPSHVTAAYPAPPSSSGYYGSPSMMHHSHHGPSGYPGGSMPSSLGSGGPSYYFSSGPASSSSPYAKSYPAPPSMRYVSSASPYGPAASPSGAASSPTGSKIIVIRDSSGAHGSGYPSASSAMLAGSPGSYMVKGKLSAYAPGGPGPSYISAPSSLSYAAGPPSSSGYPGSYSSSGSFSGGHGGSTFLGYSV